MWWEKLKQKFSCIHSAQSVRSWASNYNSVLQKIANESRITYIPPTNGDWTGELHSRHKGIDFSYASGGLPPGYDGAYGALFKFMWPENSCILVEKASLDLIVKSFDDPSDAFSPFYGIKEMNVTTLNDRFVLVSEYSSAPKLEIFGIFNYMSNALWGIKFLKGEGIEVWFHGAANEHDLGITLKFLKALEAGQ